MADEDIREALQRGRSHKDNSLTLLQPARFSSKNVLNTKGNTEDDFPLSFYEPLDPEEQKLDSHPVKSPPAPNRTTSYASSSKSVKEKYGLREMIIRSSRLTSKRIRGEKVHKEKLNDLELVSDMDQESPAAAESQKDIHNRILSLPSRLGVRPLFDSFKRHDAETSFEGAITALSTEFEEVVQQLRDTDANLRTVEKENSERYKAFQTLYLSHTEALSKIVALEREKKTAVHYFQDRINTLLEEKALTNSNRKRTKSISTQTTPHDEPLVKHVFADFPSDLLRWKTPENHHFDIRDSLAATQTISFNQIELDAVSLLWKEMLNLAPKLQVAPLVSAYRKHQGNTSFPGALKALIEEYGEAVGGLRKLYGELDIASARDQERGYEHQDLYDAHVHVKNKLQSHQLEKEDCLAEISRLERERQQLMLEYSNTQRRYEQQQRDIDTIHSRELEDTIVELNLEHMKAIEMNDKKYQTRKAQYMEEIDHLSGQLTRQRALRPTNDRELSTKFQVLVQDVDDLSRRQWTNKHSDWDAIVAEMEGNLRRNRNGVVKYIVWSILYRHLFATPFQLFGEKEGSELVAQWLRAFGDGKRIHLSFGAWRNAKEILGCQITPTRGSERWRWELFREIKDALSEPISEFDSRFKLKASLPNTIDKLVSELTAAMLQFSSVEDADKRLIQEIAHKAVETAVEFNCQPFRLNVKFALENSATATLVEELAKGATIEITTIPGLERIGTSDGYEFDIKEEIVELERRSLKLK